MRYIILIGVILLIMMILLYINMRHREGFKIEGLPEVYKSELSETLRHSFAKLKPYDYNFETNDKKYRCSFKNSPYVQNIPFYRTIIPKNKNVAYEVKSTNCSKSLPPQFCNKNKKYDTKYELYEESNNFLNYDDDKYKVFLHIPDEGTTYKDLTLVNYADVQPTFETKYDVCKPNERSYNTTMNLADNFPCGVLYCNESSIEKDYESLNVKAKELYHEVMKEEHESKIDYILGTLNFKEWIKNLKISQDKNYKTVTSLCDVEIKEPEPEQEPNPEQKTVTEMVINDNTLPEIIQQDIEGNR